MLIIQQGDEYLISFIIKKDGAYITPSNVQDVRIQINDTLKSYLNNQLTFDSTTNEWQYPLTQEESFALEDTTANIQVGIKETSQITYSPTQAAYVGKSIIDKEW